jgi:hypothetical protein
VIVGASREASLLGMSDPGIRFSVYIVNQSDYPFRAQIQVNNIHVNKAWNLRLCIPPSPFLEAALHITLVVLLSTC